MLVIWIILEVFLDKIDLTGPLFFKFIFFYQPIVFFMLITNVYKLCLACTKFESYSYQRTIYYTDSKHFPMQKVDYVFDT